HEAQSAGPRIGQRALMPSQTSMRASRACARFRTRTRTRETRQFYEQVSIASKDAKTPESPKKQRVSEAFSGRNFGKTLLSQTPKTEKLNWQRKDFIVLLQACCETKKIFHFLTRIRGFSPTL
ncbi:hypothetical protein, partial [Erythrobacter litoralis]|uniref:hypothetical protein n=1 Tax=Erythrobacter litoralis TaxID=39960 RepID=UPI0019D6E217